MPENTVSFSSIRPAVRYAGVTVTAPWEPLRVRLTYDHRLFYAERSGAAIRIGDECFEMDAGSVLLFRSGTPYCVDHRGQPAPLFVVNFDFFPQDGAVLPETPLPMASSADFRPALVRERPAFEEGFLRDEPCYLREMETLFPFLQQMEQENKRGERFCVQQLESLLHVCLNMIFRRWMQPRPERCAGQDVLAYIDAHCAEPLDNRSLGERFHYHPNYISQLVRAQTGLPLHRYLLRQRVRRATELIQDSGMSIAEIAAQVGFRDASYFTQYFRRLTGRTPGEFRQFRQNAGRHEKKRQDDVW